MTVRKRFIILSRLVRFSAMLAIVLSLLPVSPISAASSAAPAPAGSPAPVSAAERAGNPELRYANLWTTTLQATARPASSPQPARAPDAAVISATKTDVLQNDIPPAGPTAGDTIRYTVVINNSGNDPAAAVAFSDTIDPSTTLSGVAHVSPLAFDDSYDSLGNVGITVPAANGVLANDVDPDSSVSLGVVAAAGATSQGGAFAIAADGSFSYGPPAGYEGPDSFTYTLTDNDPLTPNDTGTVDITVSNVIWFIQNTAAAGGDGRLSAPFNSISAFNSFAADQTGDIIFVFEGVGSYPGAFTLLNQQQLIGQGVALAAAAGLTVPPYSNALPGATANSLLTNLSGNSIALGNNNVIKGLTVGNTSGTAIYAPFGFGTLTVRNVAISGSGAALDLATGTLDAIFDNIASSGASAGGWAISLNTVGGSLAVSNPGAGTDTGITSAGFGGISIINAPAGASYNFGETSVGSSDIGVLIQGNNAGATTTFANLAITVSNGTGLTTNNAGVISIGGTASTISATNGSAMVVNGQANFGAGATFASVSSANGPTGVNLIMNGVTGNLTMNGGSITGSTAAGVAVSGGSANVTYAGSITNSVNRSASITGRTGGSVTLSGNITDTGSGILVQNNTGGSTTFSGSSKSINVGTSKGVTLSSNAGHTITFSGGGLVITTSSGTGFEASGGAAGVNVTGTGNTINASTGRALDVASTTIGSSGMTFQSISSGASGNLGIVLNNTGSLGGLTVTGTGAAGSGGNISGKTGNTDGVSLTSTKNASLAYMTINNNTRNGIIGQSINGLTLNNVMLDGNADQFTPDEAGLLLLETTGTVNITNTTIKNSYEHNVKVENNSGTLTAFNVTGGTIGPNPVGTGAQGLLFQGNGTANMTLNVNGTTFTGNQSNGIFADTSGGTMDVTVQNGTMTNNNVGVGVSVSNSGNMTFDILNNVAASPLQAQSIGINVFANASHSGTFVGTIAGNFVGQAGSTASGSIDGDGIKVSNEGSGTLTVLINSNTVREVGNGLGTGFEGIFVINSVAAGTVNVTVTNNTVDQIRDDRGLHVRQTIAGTTCADIRGNAFTNIFSATPLRVSQTAGTYNVVQANPTGPAPNLSTVNGNVAVSVAGTINFSVGASCPTPTSAPESPDTQPDVTVATSTVAVASGSSAGQPRAAGQISAFNLPIDQSAAPVRSAAAPASAPDQSTNLPIYQTPSGSRAPESGETVNVNIGTLPAGKSVTIIFDVIIDTPTTPQQIVSQVCNQGTISATDLSSVLTDDPDVGGGADPTCTTLALGSITIAKDQVPNGNAPFGFTSTISGSTSFNVNGDSSLPIANITAGSYTVTENDPAPLFSLTGLACDDGASGVPSSGNSGTRIATINLEPGETVTCTFTNTQAGVDLQVTKSDGDVTAQPGDTIAYTLAYTNAGTGGAAGVVLTETVPANTTFNAGASTAGWNCVPDGNAGSTCTLAIGALAGAGNGTATFAVDVVSPLPPQVTQISNTVCIGDDGALGPDQNPGDNCGDDTTPLQAGSITIAKVTNPAGGTGFNFSGDLGAFSLDDGQQQPFGGLASGDYDVTEIVPAGWLLATVVCTGGGYTLIADGVTVNLDPGENIVCTFTNQQLPLFLQLNKDVNGPTSVTLPGGSGTVSYTVAYTSTAIVTGTAVFTDTPSIDIGSVTCSDLTQATLGPGESGSQVVDCAVTITPDLCVELNATLNNTVTADFSPVDGFGAGAPTVTITVPPSDPNNPLCNPVFSIVLTKTVGLDPNVCAATDTINLPFGGDQVTYCYEVENTGNIDLTFHNLVDTELGTILNAFPYSLSPGSSVFVTQTAFIDVTSVNTATWTAYNPVEGPGLPPGEAMASDTATVTVDLPDPAIVLTKTVGLDANVCAATDMIIVPENTEVTYCYFVENTGNTPFNLHDLVDTELGNILLDFPYLLTPGSTVWMTQTATIAVTTVNTATWTAVLAPVEGNITAQATDVATVTVLPPTAVRLDSLQAASSEADRTLVPPMLLAAVVAAGGVLAWRRRRRSLAP